MVGLLEAVVAILMWIAGLLGATAVAIPDAIPDGIPTTAPPACVQLPELGEGMQAGYCP